MTESRIRKTIRDLTSKIESQDSTNFKPIILSDSKGRYLRLSQTREEESRSKIVWWGKSGAKVEDRLDWLKYNFDREASKYSNIIVFIWLGTCDLTSKKNDGSICLAERESNVDYIEAKFRDIDTFLKSRGCKTIFLEVPYFSIRYWNKIKCHCNPDQYIDDDITLKNQIDILNGRIVDINRANNSLSPKLNIDLENSRAVKGRGRTKYSINWRLIKDGVHPDRLVSEVWFLKLKYYIGLNKN